MHQLRWLLVLALAGGLFALALSNEAYDLTSPPSLTYHVLLRKIYSIGAFTLVGAALLWAWSPPPRRALLLAAACIAAYSGLIETGQKIADGSESLAWNLIDVACGAAGGALAALVSPWVRAR
ncbi:MAG: hypothetical protein ABR591_12450 [Candidatus Velthaea sp.]